MTRPVLHRAEAKAIILAKHPHSAGCNRHQLGTWDRSGVCDRCNAFTAFNAATVTA